MCFTVALYIQSLSCSWVRCMQVLMPHKAASQALRPLGRACACCRSSRRGRALACVSSCRQANHGIVTASVHNACMISHTQKCCVVKSAKVSLFTAGLHLLQVHTAQFNKCVCTRAQAELGALVAAATAELGGWDADHRARAAALLRAALVCTEEAAARHAHLLAPALCRVIGRDNLPKRSEICVAC